MVEPALSRVFDGQGPNVVGRRTIPHSNEVYSPPVLDAHQMSAVLDYVRQTAESINIVANRIAKDAATAQEVTPSQSEERIASPSSSKPFSNNFQSPRRPEPHARQGAGSGSRAHHNFMAPTNSAARTPTVLHNLEALTNMIAEELIESTLVDTAASVAIDSNKPSSPNGTTQDYFQGLLQEMSTQARREEELTERWGETLFALRALASRS